MKQHSLRLRLLAGAGIWVAAALVVAGIAIVGIFAASAERDKLEDLLGSLDQVLTSIDASIPLADLRPRLNDPRYNAPAGGLYWQVVDLDTGELGQSRSMWDAQLKVPAPPEPGKAAFADVLGPQDQALGVLTQDVLLDSGTGGQRRLRASVAEDLALRGRDLRRVALDVAGALLAVGAALVLAAWLQVYLGLQPLRALRGAVENVVQGRAARLEGPFPTEVAPVANEVNALLNSHDRAIEFARARADDLAHGLKTPLAVLTATAGRLREQGDTTNAGVLELLSEEMAERIDYQLRLAQLRMRSAEHVLNASLDQALLRSVAVIRKAGRGPEIFWKVDADKANVDMDPHDLMELVGVLLENAAKWARTQVEVICKPAGDMVECIIRDDGPGLSDEDIAKLGKRGGRLDEERSGTGFGIAIAREILELNGGSLGIARSGSGGLQATVRVPAAPAALHS